MVKRILGGILFICIGIFLMIASIKMIFVDDPKAKKLLSEVKDNFIPVFHEYVSSVTEDDSIYVVYDENHDRGEEKIHRLRKCIQKVCPALEESLIHLQKNTLYDVEASSLKYPALSFSAPLPAYNDAYIYSSPYNNFISDDTSWTYIDHVFEEPFYYIGYATSALASFELFLESRVDFHSGVAKYMTLTTVPAGTKYQEALTIAGLNNIFEPGTIAKISEDLSKEFDLKK